MHIFDRAKRIYKHINYTIESSNNISSYGNAIESTFGTNDFTISVEEESNLIVPITTISTEYNCIL